MLDCAYLGISKGWTWTELPRCDGSRSSLRQGWKDVHCDMSWLDPCLVFYVSGPKDMVCQGVMDWSWCGLIIEGGFFFISFLHCFFPHFLSLW